jgi:KUP system potassium uptake protein
LALKTDEGNKSRQATLLIGSLGVVYGDIGTSPLYALRECFGGDHGVPPTPEHALGIVSLVLWTLITIVCLKYLVFVMRAHNRGEGGDLALLALIHQSIEGDKRIAGKVLLLGVLGASLLYGDGMITPAVTVLSSVEGLGVATPALKPFILPISLVILVGLFYFQKHGTGRIGSIFGPVMMVWFVTIGALGIRGILMNPKILAAVSPHYGIWFLLESPKTSFIVLGAVFLCVTGAEALYADMGHFGPTPIRRAWFGIVFPGLILNYFGQGALVIQDPSAVQNPFYLLAPSWGLYPLIGLATAAAVIASQALISGAYSITMQAIQMGLLPRLNIRHTSESTKGQIYIPPVNWFLMVACLGLVLSFKNSSALAGAYGIAVSVAMTITTCLFFVAASRVWKWPLWLAAVTSGVFLTIELAFVTANGLKLMKGGWFPLVVSGFLCVLMMTWHTGRRILRDRLSGAFLPLDLFLEDLERTPPKRVSGTAVYLSGNHSGTPLALLHNLKHNKVLHEKVIILTISTQDVPFVRMKNKLKVERVRPDVWRVIGNYGFMEQANIPKLLERANEHGLPFEMNRATFFLSRETIVAGKTPGMAGWRRHIFSALARNAQSATAFFNLPANRVVELGMQVEL